jgi:tetratricopeptide (TPR) repeat protein
MKRLPWWGVVFLLALALRLAHVCFVDKPIGQRHIYLTSALWITEHPRPADFVLRHDDWRDWPGGWTLAPLYPLFLAGLFSAFGTDVRVFQVAQALMDSGAAVAVAALGRSVAPRRGVWAGVAYALYWPSAFLCTRPLTENLHTFLLTPALLLLVGATARAGLGSAAGGGALLGLSALARAVSAAFIPVAALLPVGAHGWARGRRCGLAILAAGVAVILPWTARNVLLRGDRTLIEDVSAFNLWNDNPYVDAETLAAQKRSLAEAKAPGERRARALSFAVANIASSPLALLAKAWDNARHLVRPDGLHQWLVAEDPEAWWWHAGSVLLGDAMVVGGLALFSCGALGVARTAPGSVLVAWAAYYVLLLLVPYHSEIRYRSAVVPAFLALAAAGAEALEARPRGRLTRLAAAFGIACALSALSPYAAPLLRALRARWVLRAAHVALDAGDLAASRAAAHRAGAIDPGAASPWLTWGSWLSRRGFPAEAVAAYEEALRRRPGHPAAVLALPALLREAGYAKRAERALAEARVLETTIPDALEVAWRELPPPRADRIEMGATDLGAIRGFHVLEDGARWTRPRAWLRLVPPSAGGTWDVTLAMGAPAPAPLPRPVVTIRAAGNDPIRLALGPEVQDHTVTLRRAGEGPLLVEVLAPAWSRSGGIVDRGVLVKSLEMRPSGDR